MHLQRGLIVGVMEHPTRPEEFPLIQVAMVAWCDGMEQDTLKTQRMMVWRVSLVEPASSPVSWYGTAMRG